ncbi:exodeoxyribonuclease V subunit alpha [Paraburkholderia sediminicola]|uniref:exodeoxyribonuclease V subunit alpha n=1 Tax=Paraburkholderia sediminicola TaxID=458836 RepID=UPI0038BB8C3C
MSTLAEPLAPASGASHAPLDQVLADLKSCSDAGWLRRLDYAFAEFVARRAVSNGPLAAVTAALLALMEGRGHTCIELAAWTAVPLDVRLAAARNAQTEEVAAAGASLARLIPATAQDWAAQLRATGVVYDASADDQNEPLVLDGTTLYLRRYWRHEGDVAAGIAAHVAETVPLDTEAVRTWLQKLFGPIADTRQPDWQRVACAVALRRRFTLITGGPGTGKTYTVARLLALLFATAAAGSEPRVALAAPTGKAAARLTASISSALENLDVQLANGVHARELAGMIGPARTLHKLLGARPDTARLRHDAANPLDVDVIVVDEASMVHLGMMAALLNAIPPHARLILLGDKDQLASVEAGAVLGDLCSDAGGAAYDAATRDYIHATTGFQLAQSDATRNSGLAQQAVMLTESRRFAGAIGQLATHINAGDVTGAEKVLSTREDAEARWLVTPTPAAIVQLASQGAEDSAAGYASYLHVIAARADYADDHDRWALDVLTAFDRFRVLCALRDTAWGVSGLNAAIQQKLTKERLISVSGEWYEGRPVLVTRNDAELGVSNGDVGIALKGPSGDALRVYFADGSTLRSVLCSRVAHVETAFAMTVHKSQGSEFGHTMLVLPPEQSAVVTRELVYTGVTRARSRLTLVSANREIFAYAIAHTTDRTSALGRRLEVAFITRPSHS